MRRRRRRRIPGEGGEGKGHREGGNGKGGGDGGWVDKEGCRKRSTQKVGISRRSRLEKSGLKEKKLKQMYRLTD